MPQKQQLHPRRREAVNVAGFVVGIGGEQYMPRFLVENVTKDNNRLTRIDMSTFS